MENNIIQAVLDNSTDYTDDFIVDGMDGATVRVRAYDDNDTFGWWSDDTNIAR